MGGRPLNSDSYPSIMVEDAVRNSLGKVLIVEDEQDVAELLDYRLKKEHFSTVVAHDGTSACHLVDTEKLDLILLDIMLPGKNGWDVCEHIRSHSDQFVASTPLIMMTALGDLKNKIKGIELGADIYIPKPYSVKEVLLHCRRLVKARQQKVLLQQELLKIRAQEQENIDLQSMLFHELYGQLLIMSGCCSKLRQNISTGKMEKNWQFLDSIEKSVVHLSATTDEILLIRKIEAGEVSLATNIFDFSQLVIDVVELYKKKAVSKGIVLIESLPKHGDIQANRVAIRLIISNLLGNAVKYCERGAEIRLHADVDMRSMQAFITVSDNGPGIEESELEKIFNRFYRGLNVQNNKPGIGIGLFAVRELCKAMGGDVSVKSTKGFGSSFVVRFRVKQ